LRFARHCLCVKAILCIPLLFALNALADEAADRTAIDPVISRLNELPRRPALFTADGISEIDRLPRLVSPFPRWKS